MSGGHFDYVQHKVNDVAEEIEHMLDEEKNPEVKGIYADAARIIKEAAIYIHHIDWYISGDNGVDNFVMGLYNDLHANLERMRSKHDKE